MTSMMISLIWIGLRSACSLRKSARNRRMTCAARLLSSMM